MTNIECPKCKKGLVKRSITPDKPYWECKCLWCGNKFKYEDERNTKIKRDKKNGKK